MVGIGYAYNGGNNHGDTVTFTFSHDVEDVILSIHDLDSFEELRLVNPVPDSVYDENGYLYISGDRVLTSGGENNVHGDLMYDAVASTQTLGFQFNPSASDMGLVNLQFSAVPEPMTLCLLGLGGLLLRKRRA